MVRIEFSPWGQLMSVMDINYTMETNGKDKKAQLVQTPEILNYCNLQVEQAIGKGAIIKE